MQVARRVNGFKRLLETTELSERVSPVHGDFRPVCVHFRPVGEVRPGMQVARLAIGLERFVETAERGERLASVPRQLGLQWGEIGSRSHVWSSHVRRGQPFLGPAPMVNCLNEPSYFK